MIALRKILLSSEMAIDVITIVDFCQILSVPAVKVELKFINDQHDRYKTLVGKLYLPNKDYSPISQGMATKIAES